MKKYLSLLMTLIMISTALFTAPFSVQAGTQTQYDSYGWYDYEVENGEATILRGGVNGNVVLPSELGGYPLTKIGDGAFERCYGMYSLVIPDTVKSIGFAAFFYCSNLASVTLPNGITDIAKKTFAGCAIESITIPDSVTSIGESAFECCRGLTSVTIPDSVTYLGESAFDSCSGLKSISIGKGITSLEYCVFYNCTGLENVVIPDNITEIHYGAFGGCESLTSVTIPDSVTIMDGPFFWCTSLKNITIPDSVTCLGYRSFDNCTSLESIVIPDSVTTIGQDAFEKCTALTSITIPNSVTSIGDNAFKDCTSLTSITIPDSVKSIGSLAFYECKGLSNVTIGNGVTKIDKTTFGYCDSLTSVTIPDSVYSIDNYAFEYCTNLTNITIPKSVDYIGINAFIGCDSLSNINYEGTLEDWYYISIESTNDVLKNTTIVCADGIINEKEHVWDDGKVTTPATCTKKGVITYTCIGCGDTKTTDIDATGIHTPVSDKAVSATCSEEGLTEGSHCSVCGTVFKAQETVAKTAHSFGENAEKCLVCGVANPNYIAPQPTPQPTPEPAVPSTEEKIAAIAIEYGVSEDTLALNEATITAYKSENDLKGSDYGKLKLRQKSTANTSNTISWSKINGADGYIVYASKCGTNLKKIAKLSPNKTSYTHKKLKKGTYYKYVVIAYKNVDDKPITIVASKTIHITTKGGKYGNAKAAKLLNVKKNKVSLKKGKSFTVKSTQIKLNKTIKKHTVMKYESTNTKVAKVDKNGKITAKGKGSCEVYVYAQNGIAQTIKVTVK